MPGRIEARGSDLSVSLVDVKSKNVERRAEGTGRPRMSNRLDTISLHMLDSYKMTRQMSEPHLEVTELSTLARPSIPK